MANQRQRLARKRFREGHPELAPKSEPTPPKDPNKKKKRHMFKCKKPGFKGPKTPKNPNARTLRKHPLRVPGMKPGDSCFICKGNDHIAKNCPEKAQWEKNKICLLCRHRGHSLKNCPNQSDEVTDKKICYNCGESGHSLSSCLQPLQDGGTKFASCFICNEIGHLSKSCPKNSRGIFPKGGCCKTCGSVRHLARDCPNKGNKISGAAGGVVGTSINLNERLRGQVTKFGSGDDLEDDFMIDGASSNKKDKASEPEENPAFASKSILPKPKKKQGPKSVNFIG